MNPEEGGALLPSTEGNGHGLPAYRVIQLARRFRKRLGFEEPFTTDYGAARELARKMSARAGKAPDGPQGGLPAKASELNALALIEEILRYVLYLYTRQRSPTLFRDLLETPRVRVSRLSGLLPSYAREFPALEVYRRPEELPAYLEGSTGGLPNRHLAAQGLLLLLVAERNPAYAPYRELLDPRPLARRKSWAGLYEALHRFFEAQPRFGPDGQNLLDMLRSPALAAPDSLFGQLEYIRHRWGALLGRYLERLLRALDFLREEQKLRLPLAGIAQVPEYAESDFEGERYSQDRDWMPQLVLMAKSTLVWLDQLSRRYGRAVRTLDQVPEEELDALARWGFTGLWLIGIWERSPASRRIKRMCGNPEAESSAYSLTRYEVAGNLGGEAALASLSERCRRRGIRLASDMVPNHTGLDADWVREHPGWYVQLPTPPFPSYTFHGPNLSEDPQVGVFLEDHYYDRTDAAVVFKRTDSGGARYLYHGNDGTHLPWNDTAQLDYLNPEVREAVIRTIVAVARRFPIIRFDAAMTLTRRHFQRLWFPEPGAGGDIPSRAEHGLTRAQFQHRLPQEFWREVVERVAREAPDTLLLAEAFWLMEGYFVRTLGMHRVYNSAFMNMLKAEDNRSYRSLLKNTLEFDPQILKRYVNFLNNPDEETAIAQFGTGDKYFGVCLLMATLPGLPMFGHGQVEGLREKYGMEYTRAYVDEQPDCGLIERHEREIFPLLARRWLFAEVDGFNLFDLFTAEGAVNEDVFAYSNRRGGERALVLFNNRYAEARGWLRLSAARRRPDGGPELVQTRLGEALALPAEEGVWIRFREMRSGLEFLRSCRALHEQGLYVELAAYQYQVFLDFREVRDGEGAPWSELAAALSGRGVPSLDDALADRVLGPVQDAFRRAFDPEVLRALPGADPARPAALAGAFFHSLGRLPGLRGDAERQSAEAAALLARAYGPAAEPAAESDAALDVQDGSLLWAWLLLSGAGQPGQGARLLSDLRLEWVLRPAWEALGLTLEQAGRELALLRLLLGLRPWLEEAPDAAGLRRALEGEPGALAAGAGEGQVEPASWRRLLGWLVRLGALLRPQAGALKAKADGWARAAEACGFRREGILDSLDA